MFVLSQTVNKAAGLLISITGEAIGLSNIETEKRECKLSLQRTLNTNTVINGRNGLFSSKESGKLTGSDDYGCRKFHHGMVRKKIDFQITNVSTISIVALSHTSNVSNNVLLYEQKLRLASKTNFFITVSSKSQLNINLRLRVETKRNIICNGLNNISQRRLNLNMYMLRLFQRRMKYMATK